MTSWPEPLRTIGRSYDPSLDYSPTWKHRAKRFLYPLFNPLLTKICLFKEGLGDSFDARKMIAGGRGLEYDYVIFLLGEKNIKGKTVLIQGIGHSAEFLFWKPYRPATVIGTDFAPMRAPASLGDFAGHCHLMASDLSSLPIGDKCVDVVASLNTLQHVTNLHAVLPEAIRILRPGGWFVAVFGPLYHTVGGDLLADRRGGLENGFNHLLLSPDEYRDFVDAMVIPEFDEVQAHIIDKDMFSHLRFSDYERAFRKHFDVIHLTLHISLKALEFRRKYSEKWRELLKRGYSESDLLISGVAFIGKPLH